MEELTLLVLTLAQDPWKALEGKRLKEKTLERGGGPLGLPATLLGQPAKASAAGQFLERDAGVSEVGKVLAKLFHDVTGSALAWPSPSPVTTKEGCCMPWGAQNCLNEVLRGNSESYLCLF